MTSISAISGISGAYGVRFSATRPPERPPAGQDPLAPVAKALSLSDDDLMSRLREGQSLSAVAEEQGVSHDDLIAAITAGKPGDAPVKPESDETAEEIAAQQGRTGGLQDPSKLRQLGALLDSDTGDLSKLSPSQLVQRFQSKGVDARSVLRSGDLVDTYA
ncbi:hypothetical protein ACPPVO_39740 [Dactylosporangium sp. McL0621]|uniref:hypothetical protein n=1 Tax=Dactylosporangium sp. McL0621 TaxID=3415678 RepID=UPI003CEA6B96